MIIAAIALSDRDAHPLAATLALAKRMEEPVLLIHVVPPAHRASDDIEARRAVAGEKLLAITSELENQGINVQPEVLEGDVVGAIHACASRVRPRVLVIGGREGEPYLGTDRIAARLASRLPCPFLVTGKYGALAHESGGKKRLRVFVALDRTSASDAAIAQLRELRSLMPLDCDVMSFYWTPEEQKRLNLSRGLELASDPLVEGQIIGELHERLGKLPGEGELNVTAAPLLGTLGQHIAAEAQRRQADFILSGSHQRSALGGWLHGSVTQQLLRDSPLPVMFAPLAAREPRGKVSEPRRVLVATDLSDFGNRAVAYAYSYFRNDGGTVDVMHVLTTDSEKRMRALMDRDVQALSTPAELATNMLEGLIPASSEMYEISSEIHVESGQDVAQHVVAHAKATHADVICLAAHGSGALRGALVGSVATDIVHRAERPVLLVR